MKIHPFWYICILVRTLLSYSLYKISNNKNYILIPIVVTLIIGFGFLHKSLTGSNDEVQFTKVFWHETRIIHSTFYLLSGLLFILNKDKLESIMIILDLFYSFYYRIKKDY